MSSRTPDCWSRVISRTMRALAGTAVSTFDSLNHILTSAALGRAFRSTAKALEPGALFAFDMLLEAGYQTHWGESFVLVRDDHTLAITGAGYDFRTRMARCTITMFRQIEGAWQRSDVTVEERCYTMEEISGRSTARASVNSCATTRAISGWRRNSAKAAPSSSPRACEASRPGHKKGGRLPGPWRVERFVD